MKRQATTKQIQNTKFVFHYIFQTTFTNMASACIKMHSNLDLF